MESVPTAAIDLRICGVTQCLQTVQFPSTRRTEVRTNVAISQIPQTDSTSALRSGELLSEWASPSMALVHYISLWKTCCTDEKHKDVVEFLQ